ncbi:MAG: metalloprotease RseP [Pseudomonadota bacterium]|jgi:regulator of sigma E protease
MLTALAFLVALALLIAVHEYGHYRMALACGVKVLRFSIGFGQPLLRWQGRSGAEFVLALLPLGGYVRMLDEREGAVPEHERHLAFNTQPLRKRAAIVAAGPLANLALAVLLYAAVSWIGVPQAKAILSVPAVGSLAERAGLHGGEWVQQAAQGDAQPRPVRSFEELRWSLTQAVLAGENLRLWAGRSADAEPGEYLLPLSSLDAGEVDAQVLRQIGIVTPWSPPLIGELLADGEARRAGLRPGDLVLQVDGVAVHDAQQLRQIIRSGLDGRGRGVGQHWTVLRQGQTASLLLTPQPDEHAGQRVGRIGAFVGGTPEMVTIAEDLPGSLAEGFRRTGEVAGLTLRMIVKMVLGQASVSNLSGPLAIADQAGKSAALGPVAYLSFLALISVSLGVLNLLPLPVLDGGHLLYYLWEGMTGRPISAVWLERLQRVGMALLLTLMLVAVYNDIARLLG